VATRAGTTDLLRRHELEVNAVIGQQAQAAVARVLDGHGPLGADARLQQQRRLPALRNAELLGQGAARLFPRGVAVDHGRQPRPHVGPARPAALAPAQRQEAVQHLRPAGDAGDGQPQGLLGEAAQLRIRRTDRVAAGGGDVGVRLQARRQAVQAERLEAAGADSVVERGGRRAVAGQQHPPGEQARLRPRRRHERQRGQRGGSVAGP
jgi:hypothetical protein